MNIDRPLGKLLEQKAHIDNSEDCFLKSSFFEKEFACSTVQLF